MIATSARSAATTRRNSCKERWSIQCMLAIAADPEGRTLDETDRAVMAFARKVALDAANISTTDIDALHAAGLSDNDIADVVFAAAARSFFAKVLDGVGAEADHQLGEAFDPAVTAQLIVGRPIAAV